MGNFDFSHLTFRSDWPELDNINAEIRRLTLKRNEIITDRLLGRRREVIHGMEFVIDPMCPPDVIEAREKGTGRLLGQIVNLAPADRTQEEG